MKRTLSLLLALILVLCFVGCGEKNRSYDKDEVIAAAKTLLEKAKPLSEIYFGKGIPYVKNESEANGRYYPADPMTKSIYGFDTVEGLKEATRAVFSENYSEELFASKLSPISDDSGIRVLTRYYQKTEGEKGKEEPVCIMVYADARVIFTDELTFDFNSIEDAGAKGNRVYVTVGYTVKNDAGKTQTDRMRVTLLEEADGWRIDSPVFANVNESGIRKTDPIPAP